MLCVNRLKTFCERIETLFKARPAKANMFLYYSVLIRALFTDVIDLTPEN